MCNPTICLLILLITIGSNNAQARDTKHLFLISDAMNTSTALEKLNTGVEFYFGAQKHAKIIKNFGEDFTNKKTNAFNKNDKTACEWVFLSAMLQLQERARQLGANAVVNIHSYYKKIPFVSETEYECHAGGIIAGVALKGTFVKLGSGVVSVDKTSVVPGNTNAHDPLVKDVQRKLTTRGYEPGPIDGYMGGKTRQAIKQYQADNGLTVTGKLDNVTISAIVGSDSGVSENVSIESSGGKELDGASSGEGNTAEQNKCTVEQILELQKIGLTTEQISSACET